MAQSATGAGGQKQPRVAKPSFAGYWKRSKDQQTTRNLTFVSSKLGQSLDQDKRDAHTETSAEAKARVRRQQVRKAQLQHRQRKANYTKQLEMDVTKLRDDIAKVEREMEALKNQNDAIRSRLARGDPTPATTTTTTTTAATEPVPMDLDLNLDLDLDMDMAFSTYLAPNYTVSLGVHNYLGSPAFQVSRSTPPLSTGTGSNKAASSRATETVGGTTPPSTVDWSTDEGAMVEAMLTDEQTDQAINFILSLEHCCWDHIDQTCFEHNHGHGHDHLARPERQQCHATQTVEEDEYKGEVGDDEDTINEIDDNLLNGHALTATALALQSAPPSIFDQINNLHAHLPPPPPAPPKEISDLPHAATSCAQTYPPISATTEEHQQQQHQQQQLEPITWPSRTLTLASLRRLARTLNPTDTELAPVQAWFELAARYGAAVATDRDVLDGLARELAGQVKCVTFGAAVQRDVFERALESVIGFVPRRRRSQGQSQSQSQGAESESEMLGTGAGGEVQGYEGVESGNVAEKEKGKDKEKSGFLRRFIHTAKGVNTTTARPGG